MAGTLPKRTPEAGAEAQRNLADQGHLRVYAFPDKSVIIMLYEGAAA